MPKTSIIVPVYNVDKYLEKCIDSLLSQSDKDYQIILVNDGSTDSSGEICEKYAERYQEKIKVINQENVGVGGARNKGLAQSDSDYIAFVDPDDYVTPDYLMKLRSSIEEDNADFSCCNMMRVDENYQKLSKDKLFPCEVNTSLATQKSHTVELSVSVWAKLFRRSLWADSVFPERIKHQDLAVIPSIVAKSKKVAFVPEFMYCYLIRSTSTIRSNEPDKDIIVAMEYLIESFKRNGSFIEHYNELEYLFFKHALIYRAIEEWPSLEFMKMVSEYGKKQFPKWYYNQLIPEQEKVAALTILNFFGPHAFKVFRKFKG